MISYNGYKRYKRSCNCCNDVNLVPFAKETADPCRRDCEFSFCSQLQLAWRSSSVRCSLVTWKVTPSVSQMEEETAKGLHFPQARYAPIRRTGAFTAQSDSFKADNGQKAMKITRRSWYHRQIRSVGRVFAAMALHRCACAIWRRRDPNLRSES